MDFSYQTFLYLIRNPESYQVGLLFHEKQRVKEPHLASYNNSFFSQNDLVSSKYGSKTDPGPNHDVHCFIESSIFNYTIGWSKIKTRFELTVGSRGGGFEPPHPPSDPYISVEIWNPNDTFKLGRPHLNSSTGSGLWWFLWGEELWWNHQTFMQDSTLL